MVDQAPSAGAARLPRAKERAQDSAPRIESQQEQRSSWLGWEKLLEPQQLQLVELEGNHFSLLANPEQRARLGQEISRGLKQKS